MVSMSDSRSRALLRLKDNKNPSSLAELAYRAIRDAIVTGLIAPGERLRQLQLADQFGVNQRTVREALSRLVAEGLAVSEPNKGVKAVHLPIEELMDLYRMRLSIEPMAMTSAASRITESDLHTMRALLPNSANEIADGASGATLTTNFEFHLTAITASARQQLIRVLSLLWQMIRMYSQLPFRLVEGDRAREHQRTLAEHEALLKALEARDGELAGRITASHVHSTLAALESGREHQET